MLITVFGGRTLLVQALGIHKYPDTDQTKILEHFCEYVFKRVLLDVSHDSMGQVIEVFESHRASGRTLEELITGLRSAVPHMDEYVKEEITRSVKEFRLEAEVAAPA
jgi:hypothetical protein